MHDKDANHTDRNTNLKKYQEEIYFACVLLFALGLQLYQLNNLPGEFYGDIGIIYDFVSGVLHGQFPYRYVLSNGPLYGYVISPLISLFGQQGYLSYKFASVLVSLLCLEVTYVFAKRLTDRWTALIATVLLATSSWYLIFSRLGNAQISIPLLAAASLLCLLISIKEKRQLFLFGGAVIASLGLYEMPQTFVLPILYLIIAQRFFPLQKVLHIAGVILLCSLPFLFILYQQQELFFSGYIGGKLAASSLHSQLSQLFWNAIHAFTQLYWQGDLGFRSNPPGKPQLDFLSGIFLLVGIVAAFRKGKTYLLFLVLPFVFLQIPAIFVLSEHGATISASRTIGILPFVMILISLGLMTLVRFLGRSFGNLGVAVCIVLVVGIGLFNIQRYFIDYSYGLPDRNIPIAKRIAQQIDTVPSSVKVVIYGISWGEWGQPEKRSIEAEIKPSRPLLFMQESDFRCPEVAFPNQKVFIIYSPHLLQRFSSECSNKQELKREVVEKGKLLFSVYQN